MAVHDKKHLIVGSLVGLAVLAIVILLNDAPTPRGGSSRRVARSLRVESKLVDDIISEQQQEQQINTWGYPAALTSNNYKWSDQCPSTSKNIPMTKNLKKKKRIALCLYGGVSPLLSATHKNLSPWLEFTRHHTKGSADNIPYLTNIDWVAAVYDKNLFPDDDEEIELDLFIHTWSEQYYCTLVKGFEGTRFTIRSVIAESNERHMTELVPRVKHAIDASGGVVTENADNQLSMYFSINKALALALDYSRRCGFDYDILYAGRPDVLLGEPISFKRDGKPTLVNQVLSPNNKVLYPTKANNLIDGSYVQVDGNPDLHYIFNSNTARTFVDKMFPPPSAGWPEITRLTKQIRPHSGFVQEFAMNIGIEMKPDELIYIGRDEEIIRKLGEFNTYPQRPEWPYWEERLEMLGVPKDCFPSLSRDVGWGTDPKCHPTYYEPNSCPSNQNRLDLQAV